PCPPRDGLLHESANGFTTPGHGESEVTPMKHWMRALTAPAIASLALAGCGGGSQFVTSDAALSQLSKPGAGKIKHIVCIFQESRSFNSRFMGYPGAET